MFTNNNSATAICPSGASTGTFEAYEKRDKKNKNEWDKIKEYGNKINNKTREKY